MALPTSGAISLLDIQAEFGGSNPIRINEYYSGGVYVPPNTTGLSGVIPASGQIDFNKFHRAAGSLLTGAHWTATTNKDKFGALKTSAGLVNFKGSSSQTSFLSNGSLSWITASVVLPLGVTSVAGNSSVYQYRFNSTSGSLLYGTAVLQTGQYQVVTSSDFGQTWTKIGSATASNIGLAICVSGTVTGYPCLLYGGSSGMFRSIDGGNTWVSTAFSALNLANTVFFPLASYAATQGHDGLFIGSGSGYIYISMTGLTWEMASIKDTGGNSITTLYFDNLVVLPDRVVGVGHLSASPNAIYAAVSLDGKNFTAYPLGYTGASRVDVFDNNLLAFIDDTSSGRLCVTSTDGIVWAPIGFSSDLPSGAVYELFCTGSMAWILTNTADVYAPI